MTRIVLDIPDDLPFSTEIEVRVTDLNYGKHLGNDAMLGLVHEARVRFLADHGFAEAGIEGTDLVLADAAVVYKAESFFGDRLRFDVGIGEIGRVGCDLLYRATRLQDDRVVAEAKTGLVFLDASSRRPTAVPDGIRAIVDED